MKYSRWLLVLLPPFPAMNGVEQMSSTIEPLTLVYGWNVCSTIDFQEQVIPLRTCKPQAKRVFQQCNTIAIWRRVDRKGWTTRESIRILICRGKLKTLREWRIFRMICLCWCEGKTDERVSLFVLAVREKLHDFFHSFKFLWFYQHHFYSNTKKYSLNI